MGQVCISEEDQQRLIDYQNTLKEQEEQNEELKRRLEETRAAQNSESNRSSNEAYSAEKIQQLQNEKKQLFKTMLKEKKNVSKLEDEIEEYKNQMQAIENEMNALKHEQKNKKEDAKRAKRIAAEKDKLIKERKAKEAKEAKTNSLSPKPAPKVKSIRGLGALGNIGTGLENLGENLGSGLGKVGSGLGSVMDGIKMPNLSNLNLPGQKKNQAGALPFKVKAQTVSDADADSTDMENDDKDSDNDSTSDDSDAKYQTLEMQDTILLDVGFDADSEATHVHEWLHGNDSAKLAKQNKPAIKQLKHRLASLLTARSEGYRLTLVQAYREKYGLNLEKDIKKVILKGHTLQIIHGLLMTRAQYDAVLINGFIADWDIEPVAGIICCRSLVQIRELHLAYKQKCKLDVKKQLQALAQKDKKKTLVKVIGSIFDLNRKDRAEVDMNAVNTDLNFVLTTKKFKDENKQRLVLIFTANSVQYIKVLNEQFKLISKDSLTTFIDKKLGPKSTAGHFCKTRIKFSLDTSHYYAKKIQKLGFQWKKNQKKIADIFIQRLETDLDKIQRVWKVKKFGDGKDLRQWIVGKTSGSKSGVFLCKMLDNCGRYAAFNKKTDPKNIKQGGKSKFEKMMM